MQPFSRLWKCKRRLEWNVFKLELNVVFAHSCCSFRICETQVIRNFKFYVISVNVTKSLNPRFPKHNNSKLAETINLISSEPQDTHAFLFFTTITQTWSPRSCLCTRTRRWGPAAWCCPGTWPGGRPGPGGKFIKIWSARIHSLTFTEV